MTNEASINHTPLTKWVNEPTLANLKKDLEDAQSDHTSQVVKIDRWLDNLNVTGTAKPVKIKGRSAIQPKLIRKLAEWRYAALSEPFLSTEDVYNVSPVSAGDKAAALQNELILNNQFNTKLNKVHLIDSAVRAVVNEGTLIFRVGWANEEEEVEENVPEITYTRNPDIQAGSQQEIQLHQMMTSAPDTYNQLPPEIKGAHDRFMKTGIPQIGEVTGSTTQKVTKIIRNHPTVDVCDYRHLTLDPTAKGDPEKLQFAVYEFETSLSELEKSAVDYKNLNQIMLEGVSPLSMPDHTITGETPTFNFQDDPRKRLVAKEYWGFFDINSTGKTEPFVATWIGNTLIRMEENPFPDKKLPFVIIPYLPVRLSVYGEPDGELLEDNQKVIGAITRGLMDIMGRSAAGQIGMRVDALDVTQKRRYEAGLDYEFLPHVNPLQAVINHTYPPIPDSAQYIYNITTADAESLTGVKAFTGPDGITGAALGDNVGGIKSAVDATAKRELGILRRVAEGMKQVGRKIISMNGEFLSDTEVVRVTDETFVDIRRDDLEGNFDLKLAISTPEADNEKASELSFMLQTVGPNTDPEMTYMIMSDIARLRKMPNLAKKLENFKPTPNPAAEKREALEIQLLEAQIRNEDAKGQENAVDVDLKKAKIRELNSKSDLADLDFLKQESGVTRSEELENKEVDKLHKVDEVAAKALLEKDKPEATPKAKKKPAKK